MNRRTNYVFGAALAGAGLLQLSSMVDQVHAASITAADFTFETTGTVFSTSVTSPVLGPLVAESGVGSAFGSHSSTATVYSSPAGNGSAHSFSSNTWAAGDYYQFDVPTTGLDDLLVSFDHTSSSTGPKVFSLYYSTDGSSFVNYTAYTVVWSMTSTAAAGSTTAGFSGPSTSAAAFNESFNLTGLTALNNDPLAAFRLVEADTTTAPGGTSRVDNFIVAGDSTTGIPEPASLALTTLGAAAMLLRRRRQV